VKTLGVFNIIFSNFDRFLRKLLWIRFPLISVPICYNKESYGCGIGVVGGRIGGWGIEGWGDRVVRNGSQDGLAASVAFRSMTSPFYIRLK
jgi:hypothetical protein